MFLIILTAFHLSTLNIWFGAGLILIFLLFLLFMKTRKIKSLKANNKLIENELVQLKSDFNNQDIDLDIKIDEQTKSLQEQIKIQKNIDLENKIALKNAEESNFLKNTFLSNMSREIITPISGIIGFSDLLLGEITKLKKPDLYEITKSIGESSEGLLNLMNNIIDLSRIEANDYELNIRIFSINSIIKLCIEKLKNTADKKGLILLFEQNEIFYVKGDKKAFERSLDLVLDNAIRYTPNGQIKLNVLIKNEKELIQIHITDTGIGIDEHFLIDIFVAFRQKGTGYSRIQQGAGLGLPLAQKLMHLMQSELRIDSQKNQGTTVTFILPLEYALSEDIAEIPAKKLPYSEIGFSGKKPPFIFIVEDDKMNRLIFEKMLGKHSKLEIAIDGDDGFQKLEKVFQSNLVFDIILLDINLPSPWDGMILLKEFKKKWPILNSIPFVAQTAYAFTGDKEKFLAAGFDDYISKPIDKKELFTIIENNLRKFKALKNHSNEK